MRHIIAGSILASLLLPAAAFATKPADDATAAIKPAVSTGLTAPTLLDSIGISIPGGYPDGAVPVDGQVGLSLTVDEKGVPQDIHIVKSVNPFWDARVVDAVRKFRYQPGTIDAKAIPVEVNLTVNLTR